MDKDMVAQYSQLSLSYLTAFLQEKTRSLLLPPTNTTRFVGFVPEPIPPFHPSGNTGTVAENLPFLTINSAISSSEVEQLKQFYHSHSKVTMSSNAIKQQYGNHQHGIYRASYYDYWYAWHLLEQTYCYLPKILIQNDSLYVLCQYNPLLRFIEYQSSNRLKAHYDLPVNISPHLVTQASIIFYLTTNQLGQTRFINNYGVTNNYQDLDNIPEQNDIIISVSPEIGKALVFNHYTLHDSNLFYKSHELEENKTILTTELLYYKTTVEELANQLGRGRFLNKTI